MQYENTHSKCSIFPGTRQGVPSSIVIALFPRHPQISDSLLRFASNNRVFRRRLRRGNLLRVHTAVNKRSVSLHDSRVFSIFNSPARNKFRALTGSEVNRYVHRNVGRRQTKLPLYVNARSVPFDTARTCDVGANVSKNYTLSRDDANRTARVTTDDFHGVLSFFLLLPSNGERGARWSVFDELWIIRGSPAPSVLSWFFHRPKLHTVSRATGVPRYWFMAVW